MNLIHLEMVIQCPNDRMSGLVHTASAAAHLRITLGQHPVHVENLDAGVHAARGAQLTVVAEGAAAAVALVTGHVGRLIGGRLRRLAGHLGLVLQVEAGAEEELGAVAGAVLGLGLPLQAQAEDVHQPVGGRARRVRVH